mmetsp:Transcript_42838/g.134381  ORF Transcript_42838/g.134381 Transcript_42838/m.134381 type:complete len:239 (-) Transcript_42838:888-1604(-)|eukprot:CAMPEP_0118852852 /NCGR_PEP_ID=MMETSP1163-20130328/1670_1 /TAXON_ID=124430 /ORGANISM="Phaeomonas parva, Strain CCMP2877" /LENGTH=238 /DNA_ID=CAMNT_0006785319 /DNA_START=220 /DNA_END=936 /DNA_ORIENTATION=+
MIRPVAIFAMALLASQAHGFTTPLMKKRAMGVVRMATEEPAPAAEAVAAEAEDAEAVPEPEPVPAGPTMSRSLPFMEQPEGLDGTMVGDAGFDPMGFSSTFDIRWLREAEVKHGRVCMLATVGFIATDLGLKLPGDVHQVSSVAAHDAAVQSGAMAQLLLWIGVAEVWGAIAIKEMILDDSGRMPGDFKLDLDGSFAKMSDEEKATMQLKELKNGRLAMIAFGGLVTQAVLSGKPFPF